MSISISCPCGTNTSDNMGAFGVYVFDEDMACDALAASLSLKTPFEHILEQFNSVINDEYLEIDECGYTETYAVLIIALKDIKLIEQMTDEQLGKPYRENVYKFVEQNKEAWGTVDKQLYCDTAKKALEAVLGEKSEARELWGETEYIDDWIKVVKDLQYML